MAKKTYVNKNFRHASLVLIDKCDKILTQFHQDGYDMTLRQLYYQLVAADEIENKKESYDNLGSLMTDARLAGYIDWQHLVDRGRNLVAWAAYESPESRIKAAAYGYAIDKWKDQPHRVEIWIEKEALSGIFNRICGEMDVPYFACKGYTSMSEMYSAAQRFARYKANGQTPIIYHFGDHDPSGLDMTRDIFDRLEMFMGGIEVDRQALNMAQVEQYNPPPNFAKVTDSRFKTYQAQFGGESWELDALNPKILSDLVRQAVLSVRDDKKWQAAVEQEEHDVTRLHQVSDNFKLVCEALDAKKVAEDTCRMSECLNDAETVDGYCDSCQDIIDAEENEENYEDEDDA